MKRAQTSVMCSSNARRCGFTLIEMLVVMGICGVLALLLTPVMLKTRSNARRTACRSNLASLGQVYAVCLIEENNYLPDAYYTFDVNGSSAQVALAQPGNGIDRSLLPNKYQNVMICPNDKNPVQVTVRDESEAITSISSSYAYNIGLPLGFRNASRLNQPANTVTFYDGDAGAVLGSWQHSTDWAADTIEYRHQGEANYLFLDGHVENLPGFPDAAFDGGMDWYAVVDNTGISSSTSGDFEDGSGADETEGCGMGGSISINPTNNPNCVFELILPDGYTITHDDLRSDNSHQNEGEGFHPDYLEYTGSAVSVQVKPKGNGSQNSLTVDGEPYTIENKNCYLITSDDMTVHLYNAKRNNQGKSIGKWWIDITANDVTIEVVN